MHKMKAVIYIFILSWILGCSEQQAATDAGKKTVMVDSDVHQISELKKDSDIKEESEKTGGVLNIIQPEGDSGLKADEISQEPESNSDLTEYKAIAWTDLMPKEDLEALMNPPSYITDAEEGSLEDQISSGLKAALAPEVDDAYQRALVSKSVVAEFDGQAIKLAGFVVPLEFGDDQVITEFFLVPFFGACIHVPPPPPNQIIYIQYPKGFQLDALYNPIWVYGILSASLVENDVATSVYRLDMAKHGPYRKAH